MRMSQNEERVWGNAMLLRLKMEQWLSDLEKKTVSETTVTAAIEALDALETRPVTRCGSVVLSLDDYHILSGTEELSSWLFHRCPFCCHQHRSLKALERCRAKTLRRRHGRCPACRGGHVGTCGKCLDTRANLTPALRATHLPDWVVAADESRRLVASIKKKRNASVTESPVRFP
jgi:hypothetical protein